MQGALIVLRIQGYNFTYLELNSTYLKLNSTYLKFILTYVKLGDNTFVIEWFAGINCIILWSQI